MSNYSLPCLIMEKKDGKRIKYDWNDAEVKPISEVLSANQVTLNCSEVMCLMV